MTAKQLLTGLQEFLKTHPECENWITYNTDENSFNYSLALVPERDGNKPTEIPEFAKIHHWEQQKWFLDANGLKPDEDLLRQWELERIHNGIIDYLRTEHYFGYAYTGSKEDRKKKFQPLDTVADIGKLFWYPVPLLAKYHFRTVYAAEHAQDIIWGPFFSMWGEIVMSYVNGAATDSVLDAINVRLVDKLYSNYDGMVDGAWVQVEFTGTEIVRLPSELGGGVVLVGTFEA